MTQERPARIRLRRQPQQERSIQRVDAILSAAADLIAANGVSGMKMTDVAAAAGVPIGSVYQYFPEKVAIVRALFDRHAATVQAKTAASFAAVDSLDQAIDLVCAMIDWYHAEYRNNSIYLGVWMGTEMDKDLLLLNMQHSLRVAEIFQDGIRHLVPPESRIDIEARCYLFSHLIGASIRFAIMSEETLARRMLGEWKQAIRATLFREPPGEG